MNASVHQYLSAVEAELQARRAKKLRASLLAFVKAFWHVVEPTKPFLHNWHHDVIIQHLEAVTRGEIENLIINVPPGSSKSTLVSVMWPAWEWASDPTHRYFGASYSEPLSIRDAMLCRSIITSPEYQSLFTEVHVERGNDQKTKFGLTSGGWRMATSVGGRGTGEHPTRKIVDDPHNVKQSESDVERVTALDWFDGTISSRGLIHSAPTVVIMQRLHAKDLTGHIMAGTEYAEGHWVHIVLEMEREPTRKAPQPVTRTPLKFKDPRKQEGELLWLEVFTADKVRRLASKLGSYRAAGQLQQRPAPEGGGILKVEHFQLWSKNKQLPDIHYIIQSYDTAFKEKQENDPSGCETWGMFYHNGKRNWLLLDGWDERISYPELKKKMMEDWKAVYGGVKNDPQHPGRRADMMLIEDKASGQSLIQDLRKSNIPVKAYNPGNASKTQRAHMATPVLEANVLWVLETRRAGEEGQPINWARPLLKQCEEFPNGEHDEWVDELSQFCIYISHADLVELPFVEEEPEEERDYSRRHKTNPYG